ANEAGAVAVSGVGAEPGGIPEVGADDAVGFGIAAEVEAVAVDEAGGLFAFREGAAAAGAEERESAAEAGECGATGYLHVPASSKKPTRTHPSSSPRRRGPRAIERYARVLVRWVSAFAGMTMLCRV